MQKEIGRYLLPVSRKKCKTVRHLKKYPPKRRLRNHIRKVGLDLKSHLNILRNIIRQNTESEVLIFNL